MKNYTNKPRKPMQMGGTAQMGANPQATMSAYNKNNMGVGTQNQAPMMYGGMSKKK